MRRFRSWLGKEVAVPRFLIVLLLLVLMYHIVLDTIEWFS